MPPAVILVFGHSFVSRLKKYLSNHVLSNFDLDHSQISVITHGISGLKIPSFKQEIYHFVENIHPDFLIVEIGTNDLCDSNTDPIIMAGDLVDFLSHLSENNHIQHVVVCEPVFRDLSKSPQTVHQNPDFNAFVRKFNRKLVKLLISIPYMTTWRHNPMPLSHDGVHVSPEYLCRYYRSIRGAVISASKFRFSESGSL